MKSVCHDERAYQQELPGKARHQPHLDIVLSELLGQSEAAISRGVDGIVNRDLAILVVQPGIDVLPALLEDLLAEHEGSRGRVWIEVVLRNLTPFDTSAAVVA